jgi:hypothetical protein
MRAQIIACLGLIVFASFDVQATVSADELIKFDSAAYVVGKLQQRLARERGEMPTGAPATTIEGYYRSLTEAVLFRPLSLSTDATGSRKTSEKASLDS